MSTEKEEEQKQTWTEAVGDFYHLKRIFDEEKQQAILKIANSNKTLDQKRKDVRNVKVKCVDCGRSVGTKFETYYDEKKDGRFLTAVCGDVVSPCNLQIKIFCGSTETYNSIMVQLEQDIKLLKNKIINEKNKLLFGFTSSENAIDTFDKYKTMLAEMTERLASLLELYTLETDNREVKEAIYKVQEEICKDIYFIKDAMRKFHEKNEIKYVRDAVELYKLKTEKKLQQLANLQYSNRNVAYDEETGSHVLIQRKTNIENMELNLQDNKVIFFNFKVNGKTPLSSQSVVFEESEREEKEKEKEKEEEKDKKELFSLNDDGQIVWSDPEYQSMWEKLGKTLKQTLVQDPVWMEASLKSFVEKRKEGKGLEFVSPPHLIVPPKEMPDGSFDLGNELYNEIFNTDKEKYLPLREEKEKLKELINKDVETRLQFEQYV